MSEIKYLGWNWNQWAYAAHALRNKIRFDGVSASSAINLMSAYKKQFVGNPPEETQIIIPCAMHRQPQQHDHEVPLKIFQLLAR